MKYWPEFAANGKADIPVRWLLSHRAGLVALDEPLPLAEALAWDPMAAALAAQCPQWTPGTAHGYHGRTWGWLVGEVIRRVSGRSPGTFCADEIAGPLGLDFFIGLPASERERLSRMAYQRPAVDLTIGPGPFAWCPRQDSNLRHPLWEFSPNGPATSGNARCRSPGLGKHSSVVLVCSRGFPASWVLDPFRMGPVDRGRFGDAGSRGTWSSVAGARRSRCRTCPTDGWSS
ncbi:hypothetical protein GCM10010269_34230 [Streptomyces humidus]|uniref:Beta-lactamase-related domain-containing protein n=1 Tax=Streptomyces humidus TaxID=52259 RepID=A0A918FX76_9ACTN|nr:hypothetical protein GCM10010269_34230 [Streptomyces humidus]